MPHPCSVTSRTLQSEGPFPSVVLNQEVWVFGKGPREGEMAGCWGVSLLGTALLPGGPFLSCRWTQCLYYVVLRAEPRTSAEDCHTPARRVLYHCATAMHLGGWLMGPFPRRASLDFLFVGSISTDQAGLHLANPSWVLGQPYGE